MEQVIHTESGEGKGPVDMKLGLLSMSFQKTLARLHRRCAEEMFQHMEIAKVGHNLLTEINQTKFKSGTSGAIPFLQQCASISFPQGGGVVLREMPEFGAGVAYTKERLKAYDHYDLIDAEGGTGSKVVQKTQGLVKVRRAVLGEARHDVMEAKREQKKARQARQRQRLEAMKAAMQIEEPGGWALTCPLCAQSFLTQTRLDKHMKNTCALRQAKNAAREQQRQERAKTAAVRLAQVKAVEDEEEAEEIAGLRHEQFCFISPEAANAIRFEGENEMEDENDGGSGDGDGERVNVVVERIDYTQMKLALCVLPGYTLTTASVRNGDINVTSAEQARALLSTCSEQKPVTLKFRRSDPAMPPRGFARKRLRKATGQGLTDKQKEWCEVYVSAVENRSCEPRHTAVHAAMKAEFGVTALDEDGNFLLASEQKIFDWLKARYKRNTAKMKVAAVDAALAVGGAGEAGNDDDEGEGEGEGEVLGLDRYDHLLKNGLQDLMGQRGLETKNSEGKEMKKAELKQALLDDDNAKEIGAM